MSAQLGSITSDEILALIHGGEEVKKTSAYKEDIRILETQIEELECEIDDLRSELESKKDQLEETKECQKEQEAGKLLVTEYPELKDFDICKNWCAKEHPLLGCQSKYDHTDFRTCKSHECDDFEPNQRFNNEAWRY